MAVVRTLFPTRLYESPAAPEKALQPLLHDLREAISMLAREDLAGRRWCRDNAYPGYTSYASLADLPTRATAFMTLKRRLDRHVAAFADTLGLELRGGALALDSLWVNVLGPRGAHSSHLHPNSVISGTFYVDVPDGAGALRLEDPRLPLMMAAPQLRRDAPPDERRVIDLRPTPGLVFLWESWLRHEVLPNQSRSRRVSVSFNYA